MKNVFRLVLRLHIFEKFRLYVTNRMAFYRLHMHVHVICVCMIYFVYTTQMNKLWTSDAKLYTCNARLLHIR